MVLALDLQKYISTIPLFDGLPAREQHELALIARIRTFAKGETIFHEGDEARGFYVIISGRVKIYKLSEDGKEQTLHIFGPGEPIGEAAMFAHECFPAHAQALEASRTIFFPRAALIELFKQHPSLAMNMLALLSRRLRRFAQLVEDLSLKEVPTRLAAYLLYSSKRAKDQDYLHLDISKAELASVLGTIPETLSRILSKMNKQGLIRLQGRQIRILDRSSLEQLARGKKGRMF